MTRSAVGGDSRNPWTCMVDLWKALARPLHNRGDLHENCPSAARAHRVGNPGAGLRRVGDGERDDRSPTPPHATTTVASALTNPRGFTWNPDTGALVVALAGSGGTERPRPRTRPPTRVIGPFTGGRPARSPASSPALSGRRRYRDCRRRSPRPARCSERTTSPTSTVSCTSASTAAAPATATPTTPSGIYRAPATARAELVADLSAWTRANPVADVPA